MLSLPDSWVWDFWFADDGEQYHLFFLFASKALHDPEARHYRASIGHATSTDLTHWTRVADALVRSDPPAFDDLATWTGSTVKGPDGSWYLFYTGATLTPEGNVQSIGYATSEDLFTWHKQGDRAVLSADPRWYEKLSANAWHDEAFRDPWVIADPNGNGWHMLITARGTDGPTDDRAVVGHAWSPDLRTWEPREPLSEVGQGFGQLEVMHTANVGGQEYLLFSCGVQHSSAATRATGTRGGTWAAKAASPLGPYDIAGARLISPAGLYVGRLVELRGSDEWRFLAFVDGGADGRFGGTIIDPLPVRVEDGELIIG